MRSLLVATQFLTRIPIPLREVTEREVGRSAFWFPCVGLLLGGLTLGAYSLAAQAFPVPVARLLALVFGVLLSGALHLDGLGDTVDGLYGGRNKDDALRIMKDPRLGSMGVVAIACALLLKSACLLSMPDAVCRGALLLAPVIGRGTMVLALLLPYARGEGIGKAFTLHRRRIDIVASVLVMGGAACFLFDWRGLAVAGAAWASAGVLLLLAWRAIRGVTGDVCGAVNEVAEVATLLALSAFWRVPA